MQELAGAEVVIVSHVLGGFDGVSVQARRLARVLEAAGAARATLVAGQATGREVVEVGGLLAGGDPDNSAKRALADRLDELVAGADIVVADNIATLPSSGDPWGQRVLVDVLSRAAGRGATVVVRHHDPAWDCADRHRAADFPSAVCDRALHVAVSHHVADAVGTHLGRQVDVWPNAVDDELFDHEGLAVLRAQVRAGLGVGDGDLVVLHPVRGGVGRKNTEVGAEVALELRAAGWPVKYWLTGVDGVDRAAGAYRALGEDVVWGVRCGDAAAMYAAADVVVLPSRWEGWGVPVVEACAAGRPVLWGDYPARWELQAAGAVGVDWRDRDRAHQLVTQLGDTQRAAANSQVARGWSPAALEAAVTATLRG